MIRDMYWNGLLYGDKNSKFRRFIMKNYPVIFQYINNCLREYRCPVCRKRFETKYALYRHIYRSKTCYPVLRRIVDMIRKHVPEPLVLEKIGLLNEVIEGVMQ